MLALADANSAIDKGEFTLSGPSGCVSTIAKLVTGSLPATGGVVRVAG